MYAWYVHVVVRLGVGWEVIEWYRTSIFIDRHHDVISMKIVEYYDDVRVSS